MATALITGASAGIGLELARCFAADGHDLVIVARRLPELQALCAELEQRYPIKARPIACDLGSPSALEQLLAEVRGLELEYLVNNAGFGSCGSFAELAAEREVAMVELNVTAVVRLTRAVLPQMLARHSGRILNLGSTAGFQPGPYMATYYASKAFVNSFSEALSYELRGSGVSVTLSCPGPTETEFGDISGVNQTRLFKLGAAPAASVAKQAYRAMQRRRPIVVHGLLNWIGTQLIRISPRAAVRAVVGALNRVPASSGKP
ncbi:MAG TPA: SDR family oxidoreductase [Polyangiaceae bacterium]|nr:SDR family oxidoreductase [Polyangiaceae bacterium]